MESETHRLGSDNKRLTRENKDYEFEVARLKKRKEDEIYEIKLELEERGRKNMESYARELSIQYANATDNETIERLKDTSSGILKEKKKLAKEVDKLKEELKQERLKAAGKKIGAESLKEIEELKSKP